jgi:hypothetical protein
MPYSSFTIPQIKEEFGIVIQEGKRFLPIDLPTVPRADSLKERNQFRQIMFPQAHGLGDGIMARLSKRGNRPRTQ